MRAGLLALAILLAVGVWAGNPITQALPNGFRVITQPTTSAQVVSMTLLVNFSALDEPMEFAGMRQVLLTSMLSGSLAMDGGKIRRALAAYGGTLEGRVHQDALEFTVRVPAGATEVALKALGEIVCHPQLADETIDAAVDQAERNLLTDPLRAVDYADRLTTLNLYTDHPYMYAGQGSYYGLRNLSAAAIRWAYQTYVTPGTSVLALVGRCSPEEALPQVREVFGEWARQPAPPRGVWEQPLLPQSVSVLREEPVRSTCVMMAFPVSGITDEDFVTLRVIESLLAGGTGARLFRSVREQRHLAYEVSVHFPAQVACSHFALYALTNAENMEAARATMADEVKRLQTEPVAENDLKRAKAYLKGRYLLGHQYSAQYAFDLAWYELQGLGVRYDARYPESVERVTAADIQRVARACFTHYLLTVVMPLSWSPDLAAEGCLTAPSAGV